MGLWKSLEGYFTSPVIGFHYQNSLKDIFRYNFHLNDLIIFILLILTIFGRLRATFPFLSSSSSDTLSAFRPSSSNLVSALFTIIFYGVGFGLRIYFVTSTPDFVFAPLITDDKFSTESIPYLQNNRMNFVTKSCQNSSCMSDDIPEYYRG